MDKDRATIFTRQELESAAKDIKDSNLTRLTLPEVNGIVDLVSRIVPAGDVPGVILNGLSRLAGRKPDTRSDINKLFSGAEQALDRAVFGAFFAGPAAVIYAYQNLLKLSGREPDAAFPEGTWQFYVDYALREDTARHANETHGFDTLLSAHNISISPVDRITAWVMTAIQCLFQYDELLRNEWRERVYTQLLQEVTANLQDASYYAKAYREWQKILPYQRGEDVEPGQDYPTYRRQKFNQFIRDYLRDLDDNYYNQWVTALNEAKADLMGNYQQQMSILSYLKPEAYGEVRTPIHLEDAHVGLVYQGHYYLIPLFDANTNGPVDVEWVRKTIQAMVLQPETAHSDALQPVAKIKRANWLGVTQLLSQDTANEINYLNFCPIIFNANQVDRALPLAELRQAERGIGSHALTIFDTGSTFIFDQSHIYFDGAWGAALAEILTNEAISWAVYLSQLPAAKPSSYRPYALTINFSEANAIAIRKADRVTPEVTSENNQVKVSDILSLRKLFRKRNDLINLTVNDLLIMYRAIHSIVYEPPQDLYQQVKVTGVPSALTVFNRTENPAILIPVDASQYSPRDRLYPMCFIVPLQDLNLLELHDACLVALDAYQSASGDRTQEYEEFQRLQKEYLATLAGFGDVMTKAKEIANSGQSASVGSIKLLAHMPTPIQRLLDQIPSKFDVLNDIIKGKEVFSNVGAVAKTSTLTRFITAKDDNEKKTLAWGVLTDANRQMIISLRDFRPHVRDLLDDGHRDVALAMCHDYLTQYALGLNDYIRDLKRITLSSRETRLQKG